jgi:hypothetical protein
MRQKPVPDLITTLMPPLIFVARGGEATGTGRANRGSDNSLS